MSEINYKIPSCFYYSVIQYDNLLYVYDYTALLLAWFLDDCTSLNALGNNILQKKVCYVRKVPNGSKPLATDLVFSCDLFRSPLALITREFFIPRVFSYFLNLMRGFINKSYEKTSRARHACILVRCKYAVSTSFFVRVRKKSNRI